MEFPCYCVIMLVSDWTDSTNHILGMLIITLRSAINMLSGLDRSKPLLSDASQTFPAATGTTAELEAAINSRCPLLPQSWVAHLSASFFVRPQFERRYFSNGATNLRTCKCVLYKGKFHASLTRRVYRVVPCKCTASSECVRCGFNVWLFYRWFGEAEESEMWIIAIVGARDTTLFCSRDPRRAEPGISSCPAAATTLSFVVRSCVCLRSFF